MQANGLAVFGQRVGNVLVKNSPTIFAGLGIGGFLTALVMSVGATKKALELIKDEDERRNKEAIDLGAAYQYITKMDVVKLTWKCYIPTVTVGLGAIACVITSNSVNLRRNAVLASLYSLSETAMKEYQQKVVEKIGEKKEQTVRDDISQDKLDKDPVTGKQVILTGKGETLCYDTLSSRYFKSDLETIRRVVNDFNFEIVTGEMFKSLNEFYSELGLEPMDLGRDIGWSIDHDKLEVEFTAKIASDGNPCIVLNYRALPREW